MDDHGLFGPDSMAWRVVGHPGALVGGLRSLLIQSLHPLAMAGVANHSDYQRKPIERLRGTAAYVAATTFGSRSEAEAAAARVRKVHQRVRGIDRVTGRPYSADDPETQLWVHCVEWHSFLAAHQALSRAPLREAEQDRYIGEGVRVAALLGVPEAIVPTSRAEMRAYFARVRPELCLTRRRARRSTSCSRRRSARARSRSSYRCGSTRTQRRRLCLATCGGSPGSRSARASTRR